MKNLIKHLWRTNRVDALTFSFMNCHAKGLHSIMLMNKPGGRIRLFVTSKDHEMWRNDPERLDVPFSIGFHQHRTDLVLETIKGVFMNTLMFRQPSWDSGPQIAKLDRYDYSSEIVDGKIDFRWADRESVFIEPLKAVFVGQWIRLPAQHYHTVCVPRGMVSAWLVYESDEWDGYIPQTFTNAPLENFAGDGLYQRATFAQVADTLELALDEAV